MDDGMRNDDVAERLGALGQWRPQSSVDATTVVRAGRRRRTTRVAGMGGLAAVVVVATTVSALALGGGRGTAPATTTLTGAPTPTTSVVPVGEARAAMAAAAPDPAKALDESSWADAPYWYVKTVGVNEVFSDDEPPYTTDPYTFETWTAHRDHSLSIEDGDLSTAVGSGWSGWPLDDFDPRTDDAWAALFALPTDPAALDAELRRAVAAAQAERGGARNGSVDDKVWGQIYDVYPGSPASVEQRMAFMQVATDLPGTTVTPGVADSQGRVGVAISRPDVLDDPESWVMTLIVDPVDGTVLERRTGGSATAYLIMGPAWELPFEPELDAGCVDWATC